MKRILAAAMSMLLLLSGCGTKAQAIDGDLMKDIKGTGGDTHADITGEEAVAVTDFGARLLQSCLTPGQNVLVSPLSVISALAMTANGAAGETLAQMESVFGVSMDELNAYLRDYAAALPSKEGGRTHVANGIWFNADGDLAVERDFLQCNADYYGAGAYEKPFDDALKDEINVWVKEHTEGRIEEILDTLSPGAMMYLVNALAFDGIWEDIYREDQVQSGVFTTDHGEDRDVEMMYSTENVFLRDENATGFVKYYADRGYAFAALLPNEGVSVSDYAATLTGQRIQDILENASEDFYVNAAIPKFSCKFGAELSAALSAMGMKDAFDPERADFSRICQNPPGNLHISRVLHKTFVNVDEKGTQAGAATAVEIRAAGLLGPEQMVHLDRPFVYMIIDCQANVPIFLGVTADIG